MDNIITIVIAAAAGLILGFIIAKLLEKSNASQVIKSAKKNATSILKSANQDGEALKWLAANKRLAQKSAS